MIAPSTRAGRAVTILGGGLGGLALARALRLHAVPVVLHEALPLPRHRVCGEFIAGLPGEARAGLALDAPLAGALALRSVAWFRRGRPVRQDALPDAAIGLSRHVLDGRLADDFRALGGDLRAPSRVSPPAPGPGSEGTVVAAGRRADPRSPWLGLKVHLRRPARPLAADLEMHLGDGAYVGLSPVGDGRVNLCGLFRRRGIAAPPAELLARHLAACGLAGLADDLARGDPDPASACAVAGLRYRTPTDRGLATVGDQAGLIPPFTGHGMAIALAEAHALLDPLVAWSRGEAPWEGVLAARRAFERRAEPSRRLARLLHPWLWSPLLQPLLAAAARARAFPFARLHAATRVRPS